MLCFPLWKRKQTPRNQKTLLWAKNSKTLALKSVQTKFICVLSLPRAAGAKTENSSAVPRLLRWPTPKVSAATILDSCGLAALPVFLNVTGMDAGGHRTL
ncbi:hypothetical protein TNCT_343021 [Trichonephila clavata]|uniref:Uncharacterized protein n=1 Tax=Trichonephila clavata TaxID=2740835 RepID=A0A8X6KYC5_TRICU|nr:hypothetical protein TNCT_343021 [Trichonephila clavata]